MEILNWIENWFLAQCDGEWEHSFSIKIESLDNPGWSLRIDVAGTEIQNLVIPYKLFEGTEGNWYGIKLENKIFEAFGDPLKLEFLLNEFKRIVEMNNTNPV